MAISGANMGAYEVGAHIAVSMVGKMIDQAEIQAAALLDMLPKAGVGEIGGLLDFRV
ncbi:MAG: hypothetical protein FWD35_01740 [Oscillospiraceae bacterium]|nr:hypothetical protein [Oscillospiraceae bacterium]